MIPGSGHLYARTQVGGQTLSVTNTRPEHVPALAALQRIVFPMLSEDEIFTEAKYLRHIELFPEGQFVALLHREGQQIPVASSTTYRTDFDFADHQHTYEEAISGGWLSKHDPNGAWLYGVDMSVHPEYRGLRIGRLLYEARRALVRRLNLRGEIAGALIPGYIHHDRELTVAQYVLRVKQGKLHDPTLSMQLRNGFRIKGILYDHISDPRSGNCATLIVRENPLYVPITATQAAALEDGSSVVPHEAPRRRPRFAPVRQHRFNPKIQSAQL
jgi:GNAT superfamily N-acetyltransferase